MIELVLFYFFSAVLVFSAIRVVTAKNPVQAALFLILAFFSSSALWLLLEAEFLAIMLVLVYVGAVMVLFLFVIMMLDINVEKLRSGFINYLPIGIIVGLLITAEIIAVVLKANLTTPEVINKTSEYSNTKELGQLIYSDYLFAFELAAAVLLVALVAAVSLVLKERKPNNKKQIVSNQLKAQAKDRIKLIDLARGDSDD